MSWIKRDTVFENEKIKLLPMEETHFEELCTIASDPAIWEFYPIDMSDVEKCRKAFQSALKEREAGTQFPFVIFHKEENRLIGSTRFLDIHAEHKKLEIGWTWLQPKYWASDINPGCKLLLLDFCFSDLKVIRVQLKTDENNLRSKKAITKIGAKFEGILRKDMLKENGKFRSSAFFSILDEEWSFAKTQLEKLIHIRQ